MHLENRTYFTCSALCDLGRTRNICGFLPYICLEKTGGVALRKKQEIRAVLHIPSDNALKHLQDTLRDFYIFRVEAELTKYDLTKGQKIAVVSGLAAEYKQKAESESPK